MSKLAISLLKVYQSLYWFKYQVLISGFGFTTECKHSPSCSQFAIEQVQEHGTIWGLRQALVRLLTCW